MYKSTCAPIPWWRVFAREYRLKVDNQIANKQLRDQSHDCIFFQLSCTRSCSVNILKEIQQFGEQHAGSDNCLRLFSEFYIDPTLGTLFWSNKDNTLIRPTLVQHTTTGLPTCRAGKRQMRKIMLTHYQGSTSIQQKCNSLSQNLSNIALFSGVVLSCYFVFICSTNLFTSNAIKLKKRAIWKNYPNGDVGEYVIETT